MCWILTRWNCGLRNFVCTDFFHNWFSFTTWTIICNSNNENDNNNLTRLRASSKILKRILNFLVPIQNRLHSVVYYILPHSSCVHLEEKIIGARRPKCIHKMNDHISYYIKNYNLWSNAWSKESVKTNVSFLTLLLIYINRHIFLFLPWISLVSWICNCIKRCFVE